MSSTKAAGSNLLSSVTGSPKKAFLVIHKKPSQTSADLVKETEAALAMLDTMGNAGGALLSEAFGGAAKSHVLQVQYNPSSIQFQANSSHVPMQRLQQNIDAGIVPQVCRPPSVMMSVQLVFDAVNVKDSFMADKFRLSGNDVVTDVASVIKRGTYTVQPQTNALLGMLMRKETSLVTFHWANMTFHGEVSEVQAKYVMFSVSGKPVRSTVQFHIKQVVQPGGESQYWDKAFDKCFGDEDAAGDYGTMGVGQKVGNLLNLNF